jgi:hypothetical protein
MKGGTSGLHCACVGTWRKPLQEDKQTNVGSEVLTAVVMNSTIFWDMGGVKLLASVDVSTHVPWIMLNEQHIMA